MSSADAWVPHTPHALPHSDEYAALYADLPAHHRLPDGSPDYLRMTLGAHLYDLVKQTPLQPATRLSNRLGC